LREESIKMIRIKHQLFDLCHPIVMGIVNVTPDSFAVHCPTLDEQGVLSECDRLLSEGADWLDVGACSTRPGGDLVAEEEEKRRLDMALRVIRRSYPQAVVSVDTFRAGVAAYVVETYGVDIINDVSGLSDPQMLDVLSRVRVPYILAYPYGADGKMLEWISRQLDCLHKAGVTDVMVDPALGFGKNLEQNYQCLRELNVLRFLGCPVLVGLSLKSMIYQTLDCSPQQALNGTTAAHVLALMNGANILRVHNAKAAKQAIKIWKKYLG